MGKSKLEIAIKDRLIEVLGDKGLKISEPKPVDIWPSFRAEHKKVQVIQSNGNKFEIFIKDYDLSKQTDVSGGIERSPKFQLNEIVFMEVLQKNNGAIPRYFGHINYKNGNEHLVVITEKYKTDLELFLIKNSEVKSQDVKNLLLKSIDLFLINNQILDSNISKVDASNQPRVYEYNKNEISKDLTSYIDSILDYYFQIKTDDPKESINETRKKERRLLNEINYTSLISLLNNNIANVLGNVDLNGRISFMDLYPSHIILNTEDANGLLKISTEQTNLFGLQSDENKIVSLIDYNKVGIAKLAVGLARLLNNQTVYNSLGNEGKQETVDSIIDYTADIYRKLYDSNPKNIAGKKIMAEDEFLQFKSQLKEEFSAASRLAVLKDIYSVIQKSMNYPELYKTWIEKRPTYKLPDFVKERFNYLVSLQDPFTRFVTLNQTVKTLLSYEQRTNLK